MAKSYSFWSLFASSSANVRACSPAGPFSSAAEIHYYRPDHPALLQLFVWQYYDLPPDFSGLFDFLAMWRH
jgi:uncharacterized protein Usg